MVDANQILEISNYYRVLGTNSNASDELVKQRYLERVREFPPEKSPQAFKRIREAYDTLKDPFKRSEYDLENKYQGKPEKLLRDAVYYMNMGLYDQVEELIDQADELAANNLHILRIKAKFYLLQDNYGIFKNVFREIEEIAPKSKKFLVLINKAYLLLEHEYLGESLKVAKRMDRLFPNEKNEIADLYISIYDEQGDFNKIWSIIPGRLEDLEVSENDFTVFMKSIFLVVKYNREDKKDSLLRNASSFIKKVKDEQEIREGIIESLEEQIIQAEMVGTVEGQLFLIDILILFKDDGHLVDKKKKLEKINEIEKELDQINDNRKVAPFVFYHGARLFCEWAYPTDDPESYVDFPPSFRMKEFEEEYLWNVTAIDYLKEGDFWIYKVFEEQWLELREEHYNSLNQKQLSLLNSQIDTGKDSNYKQLKSGQIINKKKVGRNDPCPCGSGRKYKKCCFKR